MSKPVVFVIGATGSVGTATTKSLSAKYADKVEIRAGVRNPEKADKLKALPNVTVVQATMGNSNLVEVFAGVNTLYIVTPSSENRAELAISTAKSAKQAGVKHIAVVSIPPLDTLFGRQFGEIEAIVSELGIPYTVVRLPHFMDNSVSHKRTIVGQGTIIGPTDPDRPFTSCAVEDIGKASAAILVDAEKYANKTMYIVGDRYTYNDFTKGISAALGKEIKYVRVPYEATKERMIAAGMPQYTVDGLMELSKAIDDSSPLLVEYDPDLFKQITGKDPMDLKKWMAQYSGLFQ